MPSERPHLKRRVPILLGAGVAAGAALLNWLWLWQWFGGGRVTQTGLLAYTAYLPPEQAGLARRLPAVLQVYREMGTLGDWLASACWPIVAAGGVGALLGALFSLLGRRRASSVAQGLLFLVTVTPAFMPPAAVLAEALAEPGAELRFGSIHSTWFQLITLGCAAACALMLVALLNLRHIGSDAGATGAALQRSARISGTVAAVVFTVSLLAASYRGLAVGYSLPPPPSAPNVLLISIDSLRPDRLGCYGNEREVSPAIDRLAAEGTVFEAAIAPSSRTLSSHVSLLTALDPLDHGVATTDKRLSSAAVTLAESFALTGYHTAGFTASSFVNARWGFRQGFEFYDDYSAVPVKPDGPAATASATLASATAWLSNWRSQRGQRPFFVFLNMTDLRANGDPPAPYDRMFEPDAEDAPTEVDLAQARYDGGVRWIDDHLSDLLDLLEQWEELDGTLVVVTAAHGVAFEQRAPADVGELLSDEWLRTPLIVRYPGRVPAGLRLADPVRLIDVGPTTLALAGAPRPPRFGAGLSRYPSQSLAARFSAEKGASLEELSVPAILELNQGLGGAHIAGVRTQDRKLLIDAKNPARVVIFDLAADPGERENVGDHRTEGDEELRQELVRALEMSRKESAAEPVGGGRF